jgi:hypothetical protein
MVEGVKEGDRRGGIRRSGVEEVGLSHEGCNMMRDVLG